PTVKARPESKSAAELGKLSVGVSSEPSGEFKTDFKSDTPAIYARWRGHALPDHAEVRAVFIAENVADVAADYEIADAATTTTTADAHGTFTLSQPEGGWVAGNYRVQFYIDEALAGTVKLKIVK